jgi:CheY-like chemotaxis protein
MSEKKSSDAMPYDASDKPFDFVEEGRKTALVCEADPVARDSLGAVLEGMGYYVTTSGTAPDALKKMRFHVYDLIVMGEHFGEDDVLDYIRHLPMNIRRNIFVVLLSDTIRTMDNMVAFGMSVNLIINRENIDEAEAIIRSGIADSEAFYRPFREALKGAGRL